MVRVSIEVQSGSANFDVAVRAQSIQQALGIAEAHYSGSSVRIQFPIDPETFFAKELDAPTGLVELRKQERTAA